MNLPPIVSEQKWQAARDALLVKEKEATRTQDALAAERRRLPMVEIDEDYVFEGPDGKAGLLDLFEGRRQLILYHFMFGPNQDEGCAGCSMMIDQIPHLAHLHARDTSFAVVSRASIDRIEPFRERMGWTVPWYSSLDSDFNVDFGVSAAEPVTHDPAAPQPQANQLTLLKLLRDQPTVRENLPLVTTQNASSTGTDLDGYFSEGHGVSTFARGGGTVYHCYSSYARGTEFLMGYYAILDRAPRGRDEGDQPMSWLRRHDEYRNQ